MPNSRRMVGHVLRTRVSPPFRKAVESSENGEEGTVEQHAPTGHADDILHAHCRASPNLQQPLERLVQSPIALLRQLHCPLVASELKSKELENVTDERLVDV